MALPSVSSRPHQQGAVVTAAPGQHPIAGLAHHCVGFTGEGGFRHRGPAFEDGSVNGDRFSRENLKPVAGVDIGNLDYISAACPGLGVVAPQPVQRGEGLLALEVSECCTHRVNRQEDGYHFVVDITGPGESGVE